MNYNNDYPYSKKKAALYRSESLYISFLFISDRIKELRKSHNITQKELAEKLYISPSSISKIENGKEAIDSVRLGKLANLFQVPLDYFYKEDIPDQPLYYISKVTLPNNEGIDILIPSQYPRNTVQCIYINGEYHLISQCNMDYKNDDLIIKDNNVCFGKYKGRYGVNEVFSLSIGKDIKISKKDIPKKVYKDIGKVKFVK